MPHFTVPAPPRVGTLFLLILLAGLVVRLGLFSQYTASGTDCDGASYMSVARNIATGNGWVKNSLNDLYLLPDTVAQPDTHWSPLYSLLTAAAFSLFGVSIGSAKLVPLLFGTLLPPLIFLLARRLTGSLWLGVLAGVIAVIHPTMVTWSLRIETEIMSMFFVCATFILLLDPRWRKNGFALGLCLGVAWLGKYQNALP